jgi:hypothetical protein
MSRKKKKTEGVSYSLNWSEDYSNYKGIDLMHQLNSLERTFIMSRAIDNLDFIDMVLDVMDEYPDAQYIISKVRRNLK